MAFFYFFKEYIHFWFVSWKSSFTIIFHTLRVPAVPREARKERVLFQPRAALSGIGSPLLRRPLEARADETMMHSLRSLPGYMDREEGCTDQSDSVVNNLDTDRPEEGHVLLRRLLFLYDMSLNLICHSHPNTECDSPAGIWLISLLKSLTLSLLSVFSPCFGEFSHYRFTNLERWKFWALSPYCCTVEL